MGKAERKAAIAAHKAARQNLERAASKSREETDEYLDANRAVIEAEKALPWWRR